MHTLIGSVAVRPCNLTILEHPHARNNRRSKLIAHGVGNTKEELSRLETFFGTSVNSADATTPEQQQVRWTEKDFLRMYAGAAEHASPAGSPDASSSAPQPSQAGGSSAYPSPPLGSLAAQLQEGPESTIHHLFEHLTADQLSNLQSASQLAADALSQLRGLASSGVDTVQAQLDQVQSQLGPETQHQVEHLAHAIYTQIEEMQQALSQAIDNVKQQQVPAFRDAAAAKVQEARNIVTTAASKNSQLIKKLTTPQQQVVAAATAEVVSPKISKHTPTAESKPASQTTNVLRKSRTAEIAAQQQQQQGGWADRLGVHLSSVSLPSVALPSLPNTLTNVDSRQLTGLLARNPLALAVAGTALLLTSLRFFMRFRAGREAEAEQEAISRARSRRALDRQRSRFKQALGTNSDVESSVLASVHRVNAMTTTNTNNGISRSSNGAEDADEDEDALTDGPESWDPAVRREWEAFVRSSRMGGVEMWDPNEVDEGLPKVWVDLNRD